MTESWDLTASVRIAAAPPVIYELVSDLTRTEQLSPECLRSAWTAGPPGDVGARFTSYNRDGDFAWISESEVIAAVPNRRFGFTVLVVRSAEPSHGRPWVSRDEPGEVSWLFTVEHDERGCVLTQRHVMRSFSSLFKALLSKSEPSDRPALLRGRKDDIKQGMETTLARIKEIAEQESRADEISDDH